MILQQWAMEEGMKKCWFLRVFDKRFETPKGVTKDGKDYGGESKIQVMYENTLANGENAQRWRL